VQDKLGEFDSSGRRRPVLTEEIRRFECDSVLLAVGESVDPDLARSSGLKLTRTARWRWTVTRSRPAAEVLRGGDLISGASNVSNSMGFGKKRRATSTAADGRRALGEPQARSLPTATFCPRSPATAGATWCLSCRRRGGKALRNRIGLSPRRPLMKRAVAACDIRDHH